ncbi:hypothetical protein LX15_000329 [Streptoalloteichus tenebrarius]|uniref:Uncharacterized protein n=1 Tax=Streptoalloteichus tenebrarius (strain ATCC 17920 / DSM 40477 / JCM 4838 / CBS 697.72 / NBRC 16177 / NCIMB 11028 / NRRL B-12390 / A12253. 1 / ISP 5477) TaxID=1933 RepID=A0ABT1HMA7_STRSD|nr:hypothetical protein [Streptoalloteichus tenebrarius]MCP2256646.1 hypothetical protein [Streptoalloteichus tenebrarius]BFF04999.1 hypothetical protein GCM10020241_66740 [Streptoalloteichus tenebrarius]
MTVRPDEGGGTAPTKKGSRRITVDGVPYRWWVRGRPTYDQGLGTSPLTYVVEQTETPGTTLVVTTAQPHPSNWMGMPARPVLPAEVAATIRAARARGWAPEKPGKPFLLDQSERRRPV